MSLLNLHSSDPQEAEPVETLHLFWWRREVGVSGVLPPEHVLIKEQT